MNHIQLGSFMRKHGGSFYSSVSKRSLILVISLPRFSQFDLLNKNVDKLIKILPIRSLATFFVGFQFEWEQ